MIVFGGVYGGLGGILLVSGTPDGSILIETKLGTEQFEKGIKSLSKMTEPSVNDLTKQIKTVSSTMESVTKSANKTADGFKNVQSEADRITLENLIRDLDNTNAQIENQEKLLEGLRAQYERAVKMDGADSPKALALERQILRAEAAVNRLMDKSDNTARKIHDLDDAAEAASQASSEMANATNEAANSVDEVAKSANNAGNNIEDMGEESEKAGKKLQEKEKTIKSVTLAFSQLVAKGISVAIGAMKEMLENANELQGRMALLSTSAERAGIGTSELHDRLKDLNRVSEESDSNIEALSNLMQSGFKGDNLATVIEQLSGAVVAFPDTMKIESLADSVQEAIATGEATGQFAELLGRVGVDVDKFAENMKRAGGETARQQLVLNTLAKTDLPALSRAYQKNNASLIENRDAQFELDQAMLEISKQVMPIMSEMVVKLTDLLREHEDEIIIIIGVIATVAETVLGIISILSGVPAPVWGIIAAIVAGVSAFAQINKAIDSANSLFGNMPKVVNALQSPMTKTAAVVLSVVAALVALAVVIAVIMNRTADLNSAMKNIGSSVNQISGTVNKAKNSVSGYASGTTNATSGLHWVGENGPELIWLNGGEAITSAAQSRAIVRNLQAGANNLRAASYTQTSEPLSNRGNHSHDAQPSTTIHETVNNFAAGSIAIDPKTIKDMEGFTQVLERERHRRQDTQIGVSKRRVW